MEFLTIVSDKIPGLSNDYRVEDDSDPTAEYGDIDTGVEQYGDDELNMQEDKPKTPNTSNTSETQTSVLGDANETFSNLCQKLQDPSTLEFAKKTYAQLQQQKQTPSLSNVSNISQGEMSSNLSTSSTSEANSNQIIVYPTQPPQPPPPQQITGLRPSEQQLQKQTPSLSNVSNISQGEMSSNLSTSSSTSEANSNQIIVYPPQQPQPPQQITGLRPSEQQLLTQRQNQSGGGGGQPTPGTPTPQQDAISLHDAFKGRGCDIGKVLAILAHRGAAHRALIKEQYKSLYSEDLIIDRLSAELSGTIKGDINEKVGLNLSLNPTGVFSQTFSNNLKRAVSLWMLDEFERDATIVGQGLVVLSSDLQAVTEVICSRTPSQIRSLKRAYLDKYNSELADDINSFTSPVIGSHKKLLMACLDLRARDERTAVDSKMAEEDAKLLYKDGENRFGTNENTFIRIFTQRNRTHLVEVNSFYHRLYGHSLEKAVEKETSRYFQYGLLTLLSCAENPAKYFAMVLHKAMNATVKDNTTIIRVVVTRAEIDMKDIKVEYAKIYKESLMDAMHKKTSGHYRTFLLYIVDSCK